VHGGGGHRAQVARADRGDLGRGQLGHLAGGQQGARPGGCGPTVCTSRWLALCARGACPVHGPVAIEDGVADVADGLVQFVDGMVDLAGYAVIADQPQRGVEIKSHAGEPVYHYVVQAPGNPVVIFGEVPGQFAEAAAPSPAGASPLLARGTACQQWAGCIQWRDCGGGCGGRQA
jgi:hypothetical protein